MKLYNLLQQVILEEVQKYSKIITEGVSEDDINDVINGDENGKHYYVSFRYTKENGSTSERWVQIYDYVKTIKGNNAISAYQVSADGDAGKNGWKIFLLDGINDFKVSKVPFYRAISDTDPQIQYVDDNGIKRNKFNPTGNFTPTLDKGKPNGLAALNKAKFKYNFGEPTIKKHAKQAADYEASLENPEVEPEEPITTQTQPEPVPQEPTPTPITKRPMKKVIPNQPVTQPTTPLKKWDVEPNVEQPADDIEDNDDFNL
jgi:hypothetical protein